MRVLHWHIFRRKYNGTVEQPEFNFFCEGSSRANLWSFLVKINFFELAINTRTFRALYAEGADRWRAIDARIRYVCSVTQQYSAAWNHAAQTTYVVPRRRGFAL